MKLFALDISSKNVGWIYADDIYIIDYGVICTNRKPADQRFRDVGLVLHSVFDRIPSIDVVLIEGAAKGFYQRDKAYDEDGKRKGPGLDALIVQQRMVGVVYGLVLQRYGYVSLMDVPPMTAKKALTGRGTATKGLMIYFAENMLEKTGISEHTADALGVLLGGWDMINNTRLESMVS